MDLNKSVLFKNPNLCILFTPKILHFAKERYFGPKIVHPVLVTNVQRHIQNVRLETVNFAMAPTLPLLVIGRKYRTVACPEVCCIVSAFQQLILSVYMTSHTCRVDF